MVLCEIDTEERNFEKSEGEITKGGPGRVEEK